jgi:DNA-binding CsgD family transcriptional regulator
MTVDVDKLTWPELYQLAKDRGCTTGQLEVLHLYALGHSQRRVALQLGISRSAVRSRFEEAKRRITTDKEAA